jgi:hypothetical protein
VIRRTSIDAYNQIRAEGLLGRLQWIVYQWLYVRGPCTGGELMQSYRRENPDAKNSMIQNFEKRLSELRHLGVAYEIDRRPCTITGRRCIVWDVTDALPSKPDKSGGPRIEPPPAPPGQGEFFPPTARRPMEGH